MFESARGVGGSESPTTPLNGSDNNSSSTTNVTRELEVINTPLANRLTDTSHGAAFLALGLYSTASRIVLLA